MFGRLKVYLIIYLSGVAFIVRLCSDSFCQRNVLAATRSDILPPFGVNLPVG
jgi:hypothetical protein